jgi:hypothetical protein
MARKSVTLVDTTGTQLIPLSEIPEDVVKFVEDTWAKQRKTPSRERVTYDNDRERDEEYRQIVSYVAQRPQAKGGVLAVRRSPSKDLPPHTMDIRFSADLPKNGAANANGPRGQASR